jgi:hypothetical protein
MANKIDKEIKSEMNNKTNFNMTHLLKIENISLKNENLNLDKID